MAQVATKQPIEYAPSKTLWRFMRSGKFVRGLVGPFGSGKSSGAVVEIYRRACEQKAGPDGVRRSRWAVVRNTYRELQDTTRKTFEQWVKPNMGKWNEQDFSFTISTHDFECEVLFRALDRPQDVKKLLSLELTGAYINEAREMPKAIFDGLQGRVGRFPSKIQGGASWYGVWFDSNPWHTRHWLHLLFKGDSSPPDFELFEQPGGRDEKAENLGNLPDGYYDRLCHGKDAEYIRCYVDGQYPTQDVGSVWGALLEGIARRGGVTDFTYQADEVFTSWDLGLSDSTAIWFWKLGKNRFPEVVDYYESSGEPLSHYIDVLNAKGYGYIKHWLPHDARARTLQTGASTVELMLRAFPGQIAITPELSVADGIQAARWLLEQPIRFHATNCTDGLDVLRAYRYQWDDAAKVFSRNPVHDFASHGSDAFRYLACAFRSSELNSRALLPEKKEIARPMHHAFNLDELFEAHESDRNGRRR